MACFYTKVTTESQRLSDLHQQLKDVYEFENGVLKPLRSSETRWVSHKFAAIRLELDKFGLHRKLRVKTNIIFLRRYVINIGVKRVDIMCELSV